MCLIIDSQRDGVAGIREEGIAKTHDAGIVIQQGVHQ